MTKRGDNRTMGRKHIVPYGLYRAHGFVSAPLASHPVKGTGFSDGDLELLFEALDKHVRARPLRRPRRDGDAQADRLPARLGARQRARRTAVRPSEDWRVHQGSQHPIGDERLDNAPPARSFADYAITVDREGLPAGVEVIERYELQRAAPAPPDPDGRGRADPALGAAAHAVLPAPVRADPCRAAVGGGRRHGRGAHPARAGRCRPARDRGRACASRAACRCARLRSASPAWPTWSSSFRTQDRRGPIRSSTSAASPRRTAPTRCSSAPRRSASRRCSASAVPEGALFYGETRRRQPRALRRRLARAHRRDGRRGRAP